MSDQIHVHAPVTVNISEDCPITYSVFKGEGHYYDGYIDFTFGDSPVINFTSPQSQLSLGIPENKLREFLAAGAKALQQLDAAPGQQVSDGSITATVS